MTSARRPAKVALIGITAIAALAAFAVPSAIADTMIYDNIPTPAPGNLPSEAFEAQSASEFGGQVQFDGTQRQRVHTRVLMSSWGCESGGATTGDCYTTPGLTFSEPITLNVYAVNPDDSPGALIVTTTRTFDIRYRPSADTTNCGNTGKWYDRTVGQCFNGRKFRVQFPLPESLALPDKAIISVAYNTTHHGYSPYGEGTGCYGSSGGCGYDSLNVAVHAPPFVGSDPLPSDAYVNSSSGGSYCDGGSGGTGTFRLDSGCWTGFQPAIHVKARNSG